MSGFLPARRLVLRVAVVAAVAAIAFPLGVMAGHRFTDVPDSNTFHADISAIADAGITSGCSPLKYCPKDVVTREQMAAFLNRLGALGPGKTPVVNADRVDGQDASAFAAAGHDHDADYLAIGGKATDSDKLDGLDGSAFAAAGHDHDADYLAIGGKATDSDKLDGRDASSFTGGLVAVRLGNEIPLTTTATTVATLDLPVSPTYSTFFVTFTAQVVAAGGPVECSLVRDDDAVVHSRRAGGYSDFGIMLDLSLNSSIWRGDTSAIRVDCRKVEPTAAIAAVQGRELNALALGSGS